MRLAGSARPEAISAERTRSRDSATALSGRPTIDEGDVAGGDLHLHVDGARLDDGGYTCDHIFRCPAQPSLAVERERNKDRTGCRACRRNETACGTNPGGESFV